MNEISGKVRRWVHTALMIFSAKALPLEKRGGLLLVQRVICFAVRSAAR